MASASTGGRTLCSVASARAGGGGPLALDLGQLVAIDRELALEPAGRGRARAQQRDQQDADRRRGEEREQELEHGLTVIPRPKAEGPFALPQRSLAALGMTPLGCQQLVETTALLVAQRLGGGEPGALAAPC